jgi:PAS domain S-box-containing protein
MLDIKTLTLLNFIIGVICAGVVAVIWSQNRGRFDGISFWLIGIGLWAAGLFLMILRGLVPDLISIPFANTILQGGVLILFIGLERFTGKNGRQIHNYILLAVFMAVIAYFGIVQPNLWMREIAVSAITMIFTFQCSWLLLRRVEPGIRQITRLTGLVFAVYSAFSFARFVLTVITPEQSNDFFKPRAVNALAMTGYIVISVCLVNSLILMLNRRLVADNRKDEESLRKSEERYRNLVENLNDVIYRVSMDGIIVYVSPTIEKMLGYTPAEIQGKRFDFAIHPHDRDKILNMFVDRLQGKINPFEYRMISRDGHELWVRSSSRPIMDGQQVIGMQGVLNDITSRKKAEEGLRESEEKYRNIIDVSPVPCALNDDEGNITFLNKAFTSSFGYTLEDIPTLTDWWCKAYPDQNYQQEVATAWQARLEKAKLEGTAVEPHEVTVTCKNNLKRTAIVSSAGLTKSYAGNHLVILFDITERKIAEEESRKLASVILHSREIISMATPDGMMIFLNDAGKKILGISEEDIAQTNVMDVIPAHLQDKVRQEVLPLVVNDGYWEGNLQYINIKTGEITDVHARTYKITDPETGNLQFLANLSLDITESLHVEEEKQLLVERLNRAEKMESLGLLAGGVAHDLNNVLGIVVGYAELLLDAVDEKSPLRKDMTTIFDGGQRAAAIVDDLLTLARRGVVDRKIINLNKLIDDFKKSPQWSKLHTYHPHVQILTDLDPDLLNISASSVHLEKTLYNMISNASEAMTKGGNITIKTSNRYIDKPISGYDTIYEGDYVLLSVSDEGDGISETDLKRIFEPFYTKKIMGRSGTGLGLSVVWGTVKDHQGYIDVQSKEGKGTTFTLYFLITREDIPEDGLIVSTSEYQGNGESILIVDDVKAQRDLASRLLTSLNYNVSSTISGEEAIKYLKENKADLLILDMIMDPGIDGLDTYKSVLKINPIQKAIIVSGFSESDRVKEAKTLGAGAYIKKPYIKEKLGLAVKKELDKK